MRSYMGSTINYRYTARGAVVVRLAKVFIYTSGGCDFFVCVLLDDPR